MVTHERVSGCQPGLLPRGGPCVPKIRGKLRARPWPKILVTQMREQMLVLLN